MRPAISEIFNITDEANAAVERRAGMSASELLERVATIDDELILEGYDPGSRQVLASARLSGDLNTSIFHDGSDPISLMIDSYFTTVYGKELRSNPLHVGAVMLRDVFFEVHVPIIFGRVGLRPWEFIICENNQSDLLALMSPDDRDICTDQLIDIFDFAYGVQDYMSAGHNEGSTRFLLLAKEQMNAGARTLRGQFSKRVAIQGVGYAVEMAGKAHLLHHNQNMNPRSYKHDLEKIYSAINIDGIDADRIRQSVAIVPPVVEQRYSFDNFTRSQVGSIIRHGQFVLGEIARSLSKRDMRAESVPMPERVFPPLETS